MIGDLQRLTRVLLDHQDGDAGLGDLQDLVEQLIHHDRRDPGCRLVQHQQIRARHQRASDGHLLALPAGQLARWLVAFLGQDREQAEDLILGVLDLVVLADEGPHFEVLFHGQRDKDVAVLRHKGHPLRHPVLRGKFANVLAV